MTTKITHNEHLPDPVDLSNLNPGDGYALGTGRFMLLKTPSTSGAAGSAINLDSKVVAEVSAGQAVDALDLEIVISNPAAP